MITYTLAFIFDDANRVALIRKNRPPELAGKLNGIGGKVEASDADQFVAAARELKEEANIDIAPNKLSLVALYGGDGYDICVVTARIPTLDHVKTMTDEPVMVIGYMDLLTNLAALSLDKHALMFLQASYIAINSPHGFLAVIAEKPKAHIS